MSDFVLQFEDTFRSHYGILCNAANNIIKNKMAAEDIVQEVFLKLWERKDRSSISLNLKGYLYRATINKAIDYLHEARKILPLKDTDASSGMVDTMPNTIENRQLEESIDLALNKLPPKCKAIFSLSRFEGMKYAEIAKHLDISIKTVENQMGIALEKLRNELKPYLTREFISLIATATISLALYLLTTTHGV